MRKTARAIIFRWTTPLWRATLAGILAGAAIGGLACSANAATEMIALVRINQPIDPDEVMTGTAPSPDTQQSYISGEITYLTSPGFADAVAKQLDETNPPPISAAQSGQSSIVSLSTTQPDVPKAKRILNAAITSYTDHVQQQARERGQAAIDALDGVIAQLRAEPAPDGTPTVTDPEAQIGQLLSQRLAIEAQTQRSSSVQVVQPPSVTPASGAPGWSLGAVGGGLIGGLLALAGALAWRKQVGVITSPSSLEDQIDHVLMPTVRLGGLRTSSDAYAGLARSLYAQLPAPRTGRILLVGASANSGTQEVAGLIAFAAAEHVDVRVVHLLDRAQTLSMFEVSSNCPAVATNGVARTLGEMRDMLPESMYEATVVIDGGSLETSPRLPEAAEDASQIIIVAMIGQDVNATVSMTSRLARDANIPISAVCTRRGIRRVAPSQLKNESQGNTKSAGRVPDPISQGGLVSQP